MTIYISLLRGINVSGKNSIKMVELVNMFEKLNFQNVKTYIQSGNIIFQYKNEATEKLEQIIYNQIKNEFGFDVPVLVLTSEQLQKVIDINPFIKDSSKEKSFLHVTFLAEPLVREYDNKTIVGKKLESEEITITKNAVYLYCPNGYGRTKLNTNFLENKLGVQATTRNWKTTVKLLELAKSC